MKNTLWRSPYMTSVHQNYPPILNLGFDILIHIDPGSHLVTVPFPKVLKLSCTGQSQLKNICGYSCTSIRPTFRAKQTTNENRPIVRKSYTAQSPKVTTIAVSSSHRANNSL